MDLLFRDDNIHLRTKKYRKTCKTLKEYNDEYDKLLRNENLCFISPPIKLESGVFLLIYELFYNEK